MSDYILRYAPPEDVVRMARSSGFSTVEIVRILSGSITHQDALKVGQTYAPLLGLTVHEFMALRKNEDSA